MADIRERRIYLDYAATTPLDPAVRRAMLPYLGAAFGNPSSLHSFGQEAQAAVDRSRETVARLLGVGFRDVVFTGSATEANNLALRGVVTRRRVEYPLRHQAPSRGSRGALAPRPHCYARRCGQVPPSRSETRPTERFRSFGQVCRQEYSSRLPLPKIVVSAVEHESVLETARDMERAGEAEVVVLPVGGEGIVDLKALERALDDRTVLVSIQYVNNETGVVQPIPEISNIVRNFRNSKHETLNPSGYTLYPIFHTDAVQAFNWLDCSLLGLGVDLMTLSAHKCYGPKGTGVLAMGNRQPTTNNRQRNCSILYPSGYTLDPIITGGGQEFGLRSGTENVAGIAGCATALALAGERRAKDAAAVGKLAEAFFGELQKRVPGTELNGVSHSSTQRRGLCNPRGLASAASEFRAPHILNIALPKGCTLELVVALDQAGVAVSSGSACASRAVAPSHVLRAIGLPDERIRRSLRVSFGRPTTRGEVVGAVGRVASIVGGSTSGARRQ